MNIREFVEELIEGAPLSHGTPVKFTQNGIDYSGEIWDVAGSLRSNPSPSTVKVKITAQFSHGGWVPVPSSKKAVDVPTSILRVGSRY